MEDVHEYHVEEITFFLTALSCLAGTGVPVTIQSSNSSLHKVTVTRRRVKSCNSLARHRESRLKTMLTCCNDTWVFCSWRSSMILRLGICMVNAGKSSSLPETASASPCAAPPAWRLYWVVTEESSMIKEQQIKKQVYFQCFLIGLPALSLRMVLLISWFGRRGWLWWWSCTGITKCGY